MKIATRERECALWDQGYATVIGVDEAGRGPLAGPVVAAACVLRSEGDAPRGRDEQDARWSLVRDSKKLSDKQKETAFAFVQERYISGVGVIAPEVIDRVNILQATFLAMKAALADMHRQAKHTAFGREIVLVDGNQIIPHSSYEQKCITSGDSVVQCIAAASIIAKVTRDNLMCAYDEIYPEYGFGAHKGYGTKKHMEALTIHGKTPIHRMSFAPVKRVVSRY